jgi:DNA mismatch repair protein MutL
MPKDGHIRILPVNVANKIAAGEVVERPASVVKELMENAIDAGATRVDVTVTAGGRKLVEVRDNGCGMTRDDALLSIERQATSKIRDVDDIERIDTLGFRGEAVPSIASVSRFTLKTRRRGEESGTELSILGGSLVDVRDAGVPEGTTVEVRDLFFKRAGTAQIPARLPDRAGAHPLGFHAARAGTSGNRHGADSRRTGTRTVAGGRPLDERVRDLFGIDFCNDLRRVEKTVGDVHVRGFAGCRL